MLGSVSVTADLSMERDLAMALPSVNLVQTRKFKDIIGLPESRREGEHTVLFTLRIYLKAATGWIIGAEPIAASEVATVPIIVRRECYGKIFRSALSFLPEKPFEAGKNTDTVPLE